MLLTKTVMVKWHSSNKKWYESKGYIFTKMKDEFEVKVEDLTDGSHVRINVKCDNCNKLLKPMTWQAYKTNIKEDDRYYCHNCALKLYGSKNLRKVLLLKNGRTFYNWCIENNRQDILDRWDYELNKCNPKEVSCGTHDKYWFKCPKGIHKSELKGVKDITGDKQKDINCKACNSIAQWGMDYICEDFLIHYWDWEKNNESGIDPWKISYGSDKKIWIKCQKKDYHGSYPIRCGDFCLKNQRCSYCAGKEVHLYDSLGWLYPEVFDIWSDKNKKSPFEYSPMSTKRVYWKCSNSKHKDYYRDINSSNSSEFRCPKCVQERDESIIQEKTRLYLESLKYNVLHENKCDLVPINPKTKYPLPFDNEIILKNGKHLIIEVHGIQHYELCGFHKLSARRNKTSSKYELHYQQLKDRYKKFIAFKQGYEYTAIPYWTFDKEESWKKLIDDRINEILNKQNNIKYTLQGGDVFVH